MNAAASGEGALEEYTTPSKASRFIKQARRAVLPAVLTTGLAIVPGIQAKKAANSNAEAPATARRANANQRLNGLADSKMVAMARQIIELAKSTSPNVHFSLARAGNYYIDDVRVDITVPAKAGSLLDKRSKTDKYDLHADIATPADARYPSRLKMKPNEFKELDPRKVQDIILNDGNNASVDFANPSFMGWVFRGAYQLKPGSFPHTVRASTNPMLPHERRLTTPELGVASSQAELIIQNAQSNQPTGILPMAFQHVAGENDQYFVVDSGAQSK